MSTICAISTAPGVGGIAVIRVSGPDTFKICDRIFRPKKAGKSLSTQKAYTLTYGSIVGNNDETIDEVIAAVFRAPHSFTGKIRWKSPATARRISNNKSCNPLSPADAV